MQIIFCVVWVIWADNLLNEAEADIERDVWEF
jgi:hypothetical protein